MTSISRTLPMSGSCRIRVDGAGSTLRWEITPDGDRYALHVWSDGEPDHWGRYVGTLQDMRRIASTQGAR